MEPVENQNITKKDDTHYKTPLEFAKWRVNELQKPQQAGIVNETIDTVIQLVNGILGQFNRDSGNNQFDEGGVMEVSKKEFYSNNNTLFNRGLYGVMWVIFGILNVIRGVFGIFTSSFIQTDGFIKSAGNFGRVIVPFIIYVTLIVVTIGSEMPWFHRRYNFNIYRLLALLLLYIISYTELKYLGFMAIFLGSIGVEMWLLLQQKGRVEN
jgi:hypothetical protein